MQVLAQPVSINVFVMMSFSGGSGPFGSTYETRSIAYGIAGSSVTTGSVLIAIFILFCELEVLDEFRDVIFF